MGNWIRTIIVALAFSAHSGTSAGAAGLSAIWANDGGDKVAREELRAAHGGAGLKNRTWDGQRISLFGARNEVLGLALILEAAEHPAVGVSVRLESLVGPDGAVIGSKPAGRLDGLFRWTDRQIELFFVRYLRIAGLSRMAYDLYDERHIPERLRLPESPSGTRHAGWSDRPDHDRSYPDIAVPLEAVGDFGIEAGASQSVWADIYIPEDALPGHYAGVVAISERDGPSRRIPVELDVLDFALPDVPASKTMLVIGYEDIARRYTGVRYPLPGSDAEAVVQRVIDRHFLLAHRHKISLIGANVGATPFDRDEPRPEWRPRLDGTLFSAANGYAGPGTGVGIGVFAIGLYGSWREAWGDSLNAIWAHGDAWESWFRAHQPDVERFLYLADESHDFDQLERWASLLKRDPGEGRNLRSMATLSLPNAERLVPSLDIVASSMAVGERSAWVAAVDATAGVSGSVTETGSPGTATHFAVSLPGTGTAGTANSVTVTALDPYGNTANGYTGTVHFTSSDPSAILPADTTLTNGVGTFSEIPKAAGPETVTATDTTTPSITGSSSEAVAPGGATHFAVSLPGAGTAGTANSVTATALDANGNVATGYTGTVHFTSSDPYAVLPPNATLTNGVGTFSETPKTAGTETVTATDTTTPSITGSSSETVAPGAATHFAVSLPRAGTVGTSNGVTVTALDPYGNTPTGYTGTVHFTSSDPNAVLPADATLTNGVGTLTDTPATAGTETVTAVDTATPGITGSSNSESVAALPPPPPPVVPPVASDTTPPSVSIDPTVSFSSPTSATFTGTVSDNVGVAAVTLVADGAALGTAAVASDGTWSFTHDFPPGFYNGITAVATDTSGNSASAQSDFNLTTGTTSGVPGQPYTAVQDRYAADGTFLGQTFFKANGAELFASTYTALPDGGAIYTYSGGTFFHGKSYTSFVNTYDASGTLAEDIYNNRDGSHTIVAYTIEADKSGQHVHSISNDLFANDAPKTHFVFSKGFGHDTIEDFKVAGPGHDTLVLPSFDMGHLAQIIAGAQTEGGDTTIHVDKQDTITLVGVTKAELKSHRNDFTFHA